MKIKLNHFLTILAILVVFNEYSYCFERSCPYLIIDNETNETHFLDFYLNQIDPSSDLKEFEDYGQFKKGLKDHPFFGDPRLETLRSGLSNKLNEIYLQVPEFAEQLYNLTLSLNLELREEQLSMALECYSPPTPINLYNFHLFPLFQLDQEENNPNYIISIWSKVFLNLKPKVQVAAIFHKVLNSYYNPQFNYKHIDISTVSIEHYMLRAQDTLDFLFTMNEASSILNYMQKKDSECRTCGFTPPHLDRTTPRIDFYIRYTWNEALDYSFPDQQTVYIKYLSFEEFKKVKEICQDIETNMSLYWPQFTNDLKKMNFKVLEEVKKYQKIHPELEGLRLKNYALNGDYELTNRDFENSLTPLSLLESENMVYQPTSVLIYEKENNFIDLDWTKIINFELFRQNAMMIKKQYQRYLELGHRCSKDPNYWKQVSAFKNISVK